MEQLLADNMTIVWLLIGAFCIAFEAMAVPGIGFLFAGLASITVGGLLTFEVLDITDYLKQLALFLAFTFLWAVFLWIPLQKFRKRHMTDNFNNVVGDAAVVESDFITNGKIGKVKWSGTVMRATLDSESSCDSVSKGDYVTITAIDGNLLTVSQSKNGEK